MADYENVFAADDAMRRALIEHWNVLPDIEREALFDLGRMGVSPVDRLVKGAEIVYASRDAMPTPMKEAAAGAFKIASMHGFHGLSQSSRGDVAAKVLEGKPVAAKDIPISRADVLPPKPQVVAEYPPAATE